MLLFIIFIVLAVVFMAFLILDLLIGGLGFIVAFGDIIIGILLIILLFKLIFRKKKK